MQPAYMGMLTGSDAHIQGSVVASVLPDSRGGSGLAANDRIVMLNGIEDPSPEEVKRRCGRDALEITVEATRVAARSTPWPPEGAEAVLGIEIAPSSSQWASSRSPQAAAFGIKVVPQMVSGFVSGSVPP